MGRRYPEGPRDPGNSWEICRSPKVPLLVSLELVIKIDKISRIFPTDLSISVLCPSLRTSTVPLISVGLFFFFFPKDLRVFLASKSRPTYFTIN